MLLGVGVVLIGISAGIFQVYETATNAHKALCALRAERIRGIVDGKRFLERHPNGIPGISAEDIMRSIDTQKETVRAFRFADC
jgi:hypothetical protein